MPTWASGVPAWAVMWTWAVKQKSVCRLSLVLQEGFTPTAITAWIQPPADLANFLSRDVVPTKQISPCSQKALVSILKR